MNLFAYLPPALLPARLPEAVLTTEPLLEEAGVYGRGIGTGATLPLLKLSRRLLLPLALLLG
jgi:hypothetical protein